MTVSADKTVMQISLPILGTGTDKASSHALATLRGEVVPKFAERPGPRPT